MSELLVIGPRVDEPGRSWVGGGYDHIVVG
jgi:hypothetical protein